MKKHTPKGNKFAYSGYLLAIVSLFSINLLAAQSYTEKKERLLAEPVFKNNIIENRQESAGAKAPVKLDEDRNPDSIASLDQNNNNQTPNGDVKREPNSQLSPENTFQWWYLALFGLFIGCGLLVRKLLSNK